MTIAAVSNIIYGYAKNLPPINESERGHYHPESCGILADYAGADPLQDRESRCDYRG